MNFKLFLLLAVLFIISVHGDINESTMKPEASCTVKGKLNIPDITAQCSKMVKNLNVKGIEAYIPTESEAKENMEELGKILKIASMSDEAKKQAKFADHPELEKLLEKLKKIKVLKPMSEKDQEKTLKRDEDMLETVVRLSMLDTTNRTSPIYGMNVSKLLGKTKDNATKSVKHAAKSMKRKYINRDGKMRLIFSKVIKPGHRMPNGNNIRYTDRKGRKCYCTC